MKQRHPSPSLFLQFVLWVVLASLLAGCASSAQQSKRASSPSPSANTRVEPTGEAETVDRPTSTPYTGSLSIFEDPKRDEKLQVQRVMDVLAIKEGSSVADVGAGSGWFSVRAAQRVGGSGTVYAVEINPDYVKHIESRASKEGLANIRAVLGREDDPLLPTQSLDAVLLLKTYHEVAQPIRLLKAIRKAMREDARLGIIDRNGKGDDHGLDRETVIKEVERAGFSLIEDYDFVKSDGMDYFLVFRPKS
ncbi:MAG TPA: class I SAM-dependent methyltransferase [Pyrinomonadaceae bacterium]|nr:class I SAM-dependent methyltransferase [Pyrinomonadaceae bacterium]